MVDLVSQSIIPLLLLLEITKDPYQKPRLCFKNENVTSPKHLEKILNLNAFSNEWNSNMCSKVWLNDQTDQFFSPNISKHLRECLNTWKHNDTLPFKHLTSHNTGLRGKKNYEIKKNKRKQQIINPKLRHVIGIIIQCRQKLISDESWRQ